MSLKQLMIELIKSLLTGVLVFSVVAGLFLTIEYNPIILVALIFSVLVTMVGSVVNRWFREWK